MVPLLAGLAALVFLPAVATAAGTAPECSHALVIVVSDPSAADTTPPTTTATGADDQWHNHDVTVRLEAADDAGGSGLVGGQATTEYKLDGESWATGTSITVRAPEDHGNDGVHTVQYRSRDAAGNQEAAQSVTVKIDTAAPDVALSGVREGGWYRSERTIALQAGDGGSGVALLTCALDGVPGDPGAASVRIAVPVQPNRAHTLTYQATDLAGNQGPRASLTFTIDSVGPRMKVKASSGRVRRPLSVRYRIEDTLSPTLKNVTLVIKDERARTVKTVRLGSKLPGVWYEVAWTPQTKGTYRAFVSAKDLAGNAHQTLGSARVTVR